MVNYAPLVEITLRGRTAGGSTSRHRGPAQPSRGCDSRRPPGHPGEKEGLASLNVNTGARDPVDLSVEGPALQERRTSTASSRTSCPTGATYCLQMCGLLTDEERAVKERHGSVLAQTRGTCPGCHTARALDRD